MCQASVAIGTPTSFIQFILGIDVLQPLKAIVDTEAFRLHVVLAKEGVRFRLPLVIKPYALKEPSWKGFVMAKQNSSAINGVEWVVNKASVQEAYN